MRINLHTYRAPGLVTAHPGVSLEAVPSLKTLTWAEWIREACTLPSLQPCWTSAHIPGHTVWGQTNSIDRGNCLGCNLCNCFLWFLGSGHLSYYCNMFLTKIWWISLVSLPHILLDSKLSSAVSRVCSCRFMQFGECIKIFSYPSNVTKVCYLFINLLICSKGMNSLTPSMFKKGWSLKIIAWMSLKILLL